METPETHLVSDLNTQRKRKPSKMGMVNFTLDKDSQVKAIGAVYGIQHWIREKQFQAEIFLDHYNQRLRLISYEAQELFALMAHMEYIAQRNNFDKIIHVTTAEKLSLLMDQGFEIEAKVECFYDDKPAYFMAKFLHEKRRFSSLLSEEDALLSKIDLEDRLKKPPRRSPIYFVRPAEHSDVQALLELYQKIFKTYPSPLIHRDYLESILQKSSIFFVAQKKNSDSKEIVAAASAELIPGSNAAEMTDCATLKMHRGNGLMVQILWLLERELIRRGRTCAFTMARARSFGMNLAFHRLNYAYQGRSINNCDIHGSFEDMNYWSKDLREG